MAKLENPNLPLNNPEREISVPITNPKIRNAVHVVMGLNVALDVLAETKYAAQLAGMAVAKNVLQLERGSLQQAIHRDAIRAAAGAGVDLTAWGLYSMSGDAFTFSPYPEVPDGMKAAADAPES